MRLAIDWTRCDGHGLCARLLPEHVDLDEAGFPVLADRAVAGPLVPHARLAVAVCPALALRLDPPATRPAPFDPPVTDHRPLTPATDPGH